MIFVFLFLIIVVLICISLVNNNVDQAFHKLIGQLDTFFFEKNLSFTHFYFGLIVFFLLICRSSLYILDMSPSLYYVLQIFSPILWLVYFLSWWWRTEVLNLLRPKLSNKFFLTVTFGAFLCTVEEIFA